MENDMENSQNNDDEVEIDLIELAGVLKKRIGSIIAATLLCALLFGFASIFVLEPRYTSTSQMYILSGGSLSFSLTSLQAGSQVASDYMILMQSRPVLEKVISNLGLDMEYEDLKEDVNIENLSDSRVLEVTVENNDPYIAKEIVDEIVSTSSSRIVDIMGSDPPTILEYGHLENEPDSPKTARNVLIGALLGAFISSGAFVAAYIFNNNIRNEEDVARYLGLNTLGTIPMEEGSAKRIRKDRRKRRKA